MALTQNEELRSLLKLDKSGAIPEGYEPVTGRVIGLSPTVWFSDVMIDVGSNDGVKLHDPVVTGDGLIGQVTAMTGGHLEGDADLRPLEHGSRFKVVPVGSMGIVTPTVGEPNTLVLSFLNSDKNLHKGAVGGDRGLARRRDRSALPRPTSRSAKSPRPPGARAGGDGKG